MGWDADAALLHAAGAEVTAVGGCCGLAGNFGVERGHYEVSVAVAETRSCCRRCARPARTRSCSPTASPAAPRSTTSPTDAGPTWPSCWTARAGDRPPTTDPVGSGRPGTLPAVAPQPDVVAPGLALRGQELRAQPVARAVRALLGVARADRLDVVQAAGRRRRSEHHEGSHLARQAGRPRRAPSPTRRSRSRPTRSSRSRRPASAAPTCTSTRCSAPFMSAGRHPRPRADGHRRGGRLGGDRPRGRRPGRDPVPHLLRHCCMCDQRPATPSARPPRSASRAWAPRCSATPKLYGAGARRPGRVPAGAAGPVHATSRCPTGPPDDRFVYLSDVLPTAWQAVAYADMPDGGTRRGARPRPDRRHGRPHRAAPRLRRSSASTSCPSGSPAPTARGVETLDLNEHDDDLGDVDPRHDRRPRHRRGDRRRRHGGARLAGGASSRSRSPGCCPTRSPSR